MEAKLQRGECEYRADGAAGNIVRAKRLVPLTPGVDPQNWTVYAVDFYYNKASEVQVIT